MSLLQEARKTDSTGATNNQVYNYLDSWELNKFVEHEFVPIVVGDPEPYMQVVVILNCTGINMVAILC